MNCEGCVHYRPFHGKPDSDEYECDLGMEHAYGCMNNEFDKKEDRLKPCPFCGASAKIMKGCGEDWIQCMNPKCSCCSSMHTNTQVAIEIWNRRAGE